MSTELLEIKKLQTHFLTEYGYLSAVRNLDLTIYKGEILALVGESGCGKSVTAKSILKLYNEKKGVAYSGEIIFNGKNILELNKKELKEFRKTKFGIVFQDPHTSLNPLLTVGYQLAEAIKINEKISKKSALKKAEELLELCEITHVKERLKAYPHELSGGMKQRVMIAMAIAKKPELLIADEPTTALDVSIQAQILKIFKNLNQKLGTTILFITHDLSVVEYLCDRVAVMYLGKVVEEGSTKELFFNPMHPYTKGLLKSRPTLLQNKSAPLYTINGTVENLKSGSSGCSFFKRCPVKKDKCNQMLPHKFKVNGEHSVCCFNCEPK